MTLAIAMYRIPTVFSHTWEPGDTWVHLNRPLKAETQERHTFTCNTQLWKQFPLFSCTSELSLLLAGLVTRLITSETEWVFTAYLTGWEGHDCCDSSDHPSWRRKWGCFHWNLLETTSVRFFGFFFAESSCSEARIGCKLTVFLSRKYNRGDLFVLNNQWISVVNIRNCKFSVLKRIGGLQWGQAEKGD